MGTNPYSIRKLPRWSRQTRFRGPLWAMRRGAAGGHKAWLVERSLRAGRFLYVLSVSASLRRRIGDQVREAVVDVRVFGPDFRIEAGGQAGLQLLRGEAGNSGIVLRRSRS